MISRAEAELIHPGLALLVDLRDAEWSFIHRQDDQGVDQIDAFRAWPDNYLDAISVRSVADGLRTITDEQGIVWQRTGTLNDVGYGLPQIFVGLKVAISLAVIAEFAGARAGLGYVISTSGASADTSLAFAAMALLAVISVALFYGLNYLEKKLLPYA